MDKMKPKVLAVIPARYQSSRFPGRPLAIIKGKSLIEYLYREVSKAKLVDRVSALMWTAVFSGTRQV